MGGGRKLSHSASFPLLFAGHLYKVSVCLCCLGGAVDSYFVQKYVKLMVLKLASNQLFDALELFSETRKIVCS